MSEYKDKSLKIPKNDSCLKWDRSNKRATSLSGYVITKHGIVAVNSIVFHFTKDKGRTNLQFVYMGRLHIRYIEERSTVNQAGRRARKFADEVAAALAMSDL